MLASAPYRFEHLGHDSDNHSSDWDTTTTDNGTGSRSFVSLRNNAF